MTGTFQARRLAYAAAGLAVTLVFGTVGYHHYLNESWLQAFYRSMVTVTLAWPSRSETTFTFSRSRNW